MKKILYVIVIFFSVLLLFLGSIFLTTPGSKLLLQAVLRFYGFSTKASFAGFQGNLIKGIILKDLTLRDLSRMPKGASIRIQELKLKLNSFSLRGLDANISNGRLQFPFLEIILFRGKYINGSLDLNIYSKEINIWEDFFTYLGGKGRGISGTLNDIDIYIKGSIKEPQADGKIFIKNIQYKRFLFSDSLLNFSLKYKNEFSKRKLTGELNFNEGTLSGERIAKIKLEPSRVIFQGDPGNPRLKVKASSRVEGIEIFIVAAGTVSKPDMKLSSAPPMPQERILLMLATNKSWESVRSSLEKGELSLDVIKDIASYFIFPGGSKGMLDSLGIEDISVIVDENSRVVKVKKRIGENIKAAYSVEEQTNQAQNEPLKQKIGTEIGLSETISVEAQRELPTADEREDPVDNSVRLEYKKKF